MYLVERTQSTNLWNHQTEALERFKQRQSLGLFFDMGTGKTATAVMGYAQKCEQERRNLRCIVAVPSNVLENWAREFRAWAGLDKEVVVVSAKTQKKRLEQIASLNSPDKCVLIISHSALSQSEVLRTAVQQMRFDMLIVDEVHRAKNPSAHLTKALINIAGWTKYRLVLTGSPILNSYEDIYSQLEVMDRSTWGGDNFYSWRRRYFYDSNAGKHWAKWSDMKPTKEGLEYIERVLKQHCISVKKADVLDLPPLTRTTHYVDMDPKAAKHYNEVNKSFVTELLTEEGTDVCETDLLITQMLRMRQICNGVLQGEEDVHELPCAKDSELMDLLEGIVKNHKAIVWCEQRAPIARMKKLLDKAGYYWTVLEGGQSSQERQEQIDKFNNEDKYRVMIANQQAGGVGVNLQAASYMIYYSKDYDLEKDIQSEARAYRGGSEIHESITRIDFVTRGTIEEDITEALKEKIKLGDLLTKMKERYA